MTIKIGDKVPKLALSDHNNQNFSLDDYKGKNILLYFYPKDDTPGCTQEAKDFRDSLDKFDKLNTVVIGVSKDTVEKHQKFINKYDLPFTLVADTSQELCQAFGVWVEKSMFGKKYMGIERSTFLINTKGNVVADWHKVKVKGHVDDVLNVIDGLQDA